MAAHIEEKARNVAELTVMNVYSDKKIIWRVRCVALFLLQGQRDRLEREKTPLGRLHVYFLL
jgi:hypothetical protein